MRLPSRTAATPPVLLLVVAGACGAPKALPTSHKQFSVRIETTAHQLNSTQDYPPYKRYMTVHYDHAARRARVDYDPVPHMPPKSYVRRYDLEFEWMVMEVRETKECQKSWLLEAMPYPHFPDKFIYVGQTRVRGLLCDHWREDLGGETVEYFETADDHVPMRLTTEAVEQREPERVTQPLMTYDLSRFESRAPPEGLFRMASSSSAPIFASSTPLTIDNCERVVQDMGFPYIHLLHTYVYV